MSRVTNVVSFRASAPLLDQIAERKSEGESDGEVARRDLERYYTVLAHELLRVNLTAEEAALICDALNGYWMHDSTVTIRAWWIEIEDAISLNGADAKWGISQPAVLVAKLRALSPGASVAILDAVQRWWARERVDGETIAESLLAVGLIREIPESVGWEDGEPWGRA